MSSPPAQTQSPHIENFLSTVLNIIQSCILVSLLNYEIFQTSILFETNKLHHGGPHAAGGPGQLPPFPPRNPALGVSSSHANAKVVEIVESCAGRVASTRICRGGGGNPHCFACGCRAGAG